jgi:hypothetical protein
VKQQAKGLGRPFDTIGLAHIGLLPEVIAGLKRLGVNTANLERSADAFVRNWR